jgi:hypothetical protein
MPDTMEKRPARSLDSGRLLEMEGAPKMGLMHRSRAATIEEEPEPDFSLRTLASMAFGLTVRTAIAAFMVLPTGRGPWGPQPEVDFDD